MKKIYFIFIGILLLFTGCSNDESYLNTLKGFMFHDGKTLEQLVNNNIVSAEVYLKNDKNFLFNETVLFMLNFGSKEDINNTLKQSNFILPKNSSQIKWIIKEKLKTGKIVEVSNDKIKVVIETNEDKRYIRVSKNKIVTYEIETNKIIPQQELEIMMELYNLAIKNGYQN